MANHLYNWNHSLLTTSNLLLKSCLISCFISLKKNKKTPQMAKSFYSLLKTSNLLLTLILYHCSKQQPKKKEKQLILPPLNFPNHIISIEHSQMANFSIVLYWCVYTTEITPKHSPNLTNLYNIISIEPYGKIFTTFSWTYLCTQQKLSSKFT